MDPRQVTLVLCLPTGELLGATPEFVVEVPWWQEAGPVVDAAMAKLGLDVRILRILDGPAWHGPPAGGNVTYLAEIDHPPPAGGRAELTAWTGPDPTAEHPLRQTWARPGGALTDLSWATAALSGLGISLAGRPKQMRSWNLSSIWRLPTDAGPVWLKVVPPFFAHEANLLTALNGAAVPEVLAMTSTRMLLADVPGIDQYDAKPEAALRMVRLLVDLQISWVSGVPALIALGVPDLRGPVLIGPIRDVIRRHADELTGSERRALDRLVAVLPDRFAALSDCRLPDTLVHGDFHLGNIKGDRNGHRLTILDWGDSGVGNPMLDQLAFARFLPDADRPAVDAEWSRLWRTAVPQSDPEGAAELLQPVTALREAAVYQRFLDSIEPDEHRYHDGDPADQLRRAAALAAS